MVLFYLVSRDLKKIEGLEFTLRAQKNSQDSVRINDEAALPKSYCKIDARIDGVLWETVLSVLPEELAKILELSVQETQARHGCNQGGSAAPGAGARRGGAPGMASEGCMSLHRPLPCILCKGSRDPGASF